MAKAKEAREETRQDRQLGGQQAPLTRRELYGPIESPRSPFLMMNRFADEVDRLFHDFGVARQRLSSQGWREGQHSTWTPQVEVLERDGQLIVRADLPGLNKDDVKVEVTDNALTIHGERKQEHEEEFEGWHRTERSYGSFYRTIPLPEGINAEAAKATFNDGVLEVKMPAPAREERRSRRLEIK